LAIFFVPMTSSMPHHRSLRQLQTLSVVMMLTVEELRASQSRPLKSFPNGAGSSVCGMFFLRAAFGGRRSSAASPKLIFTLKYFFLFAFSFQ
jgi:hypothetical protein